MKILWLSWKDIKHPAAGGAEVVASELSKRLVDDGHEVTFITSLFPGAPAETTINGAKVIRVGGRFSVYWYARNYVRDYLSDWPDVVIEEVNTIPFFSRFYLKKPRVLFFHMLCRKIWFYQLPAALGLIGYLLEPLYLRLLGNERVLTVSDSTKQDLKRFGFGDEHIAIISEGIQLEPIKQLEAYGKYAKPTLVALGNIRPMKRTMHQIRAFELAKIQIPDLCLKIAGEASGRYGKRVLKRVAKSPYAADIEYLGRVSSEARRELLRKAHVVLATSVKEGWGLIITEAASQGTPAIAYNVDGLRDSVVSGWSGLVTSRNTPKELAARIEQLLSDQTYYKQLRNNAWDWSKQITFDQSYKDMSAIIRRELQAS